MTNKEAKEKLYMEWQKFLEDNIDYAGVSEAYKMAFKALDQEPCEDAISRQEVLYLVADDDLSMGQVVRGIHALPSVTPQNQVYPLCEDCHTKMDEVRRAYDNAMKQEPILDKIRAEIADYGSIWVEYKITGRRDMDIEQLVSDVLSQAKKQVLEVIDKYDVEIEPQESKEQEDETDN